MVEFGQSGCVSGRVVVYGQSSLHFEEKVIVFYQGGFIRANWMFTGRNAVIGQIGSILG